MYKNIRQWTWQYCTEFGWFQSPNPVYPMRSQALKADFWLDYCQRIFSKDILPPAVNATNNLFGGLDITGSNIVFATASEDPWQYAGMIKIHNPDKQKNMLAVHINCTDCGHCIDLHTPSPNDPLELTQAVQTIEN